MQRSPTDALTTPGADFGLIQKDQPMCAMRYLPKSNWNHFFDGYQTSGADFLEAIEKGIKARNIPDIKRGRVDYQERGMFSSYREYLRAGRGRFVIDICAAPFGTGFFVSWWFAEGRPSMFFPTLATGAMIVLTIMQSYDWFGILSAPFVAGLAVILEWLAVGFFISQAERVANVYFFVVPLFGFLWERYFSPPPLTTVRTRRKCMSRQCMLP